MLIQFGNHQNILKTPVQTAKYQKTFGQLQNPGLHKIVQQINTKLNSKDNRDTVELSKKVQTLLANIQKAKEAKKDKSADLLETPSGYQKYPPGVPAKKRAKYVFQYNQEGVNTLFDALDYEREKLKFTISKINELENFLNGTASHSNPNMTKELAEMYLEKYKQSINTDYAYISSEGRASYQYNEYDQLSGGMASEMIGNVLGSITLESLGLDNLSNDPQEVLSALDHALDLLNSITEKMGEAYLEISDGEKLTAGSWHPNADAFPKKYFEWKIESNIDLTSSFHNMIKNGSTIPFNQKIIDIYV